MKVSVIIATYRRVETLRKAIESVLLQTYSDVELIVVNDNADAGWNETVVGIVSQYPTACYICNEVNQGSAETRNIGIRVSHGEYISFLDDDDIYLPERIEHQVKQMEAHSADYSITDLYLYNESGKLIDKRIRSYIKKTDSSSLLKDHLMHHITGTDSMMFRREYLLKIGGFPPTDIGDEYYLMKEAIEGNGKFIYVPGCFVKAYVHTSNGGLSSGKSKIDGENNLYEFKKMLFDKIDERSRRYVKMRHYAVLAFAELRRKKYGAFIKHASRSFFFAPISCIRLLVGDAK
jgi:glycosyltransferase involved in cell wall biosynthesis